MRLGVSPATPWCKPVSFTFTIQKGHIAAYLFISRGDVSAELIRQCGLIEVIELANLHSREVVKFWESVVFPKLIIIKDEHWEFIHAECCFVSNLKPSNDLTLHLRDALDHPRTPSA